MKVFIIIAVTAGLLVSAQNPKCTYRTSTDDNLYNCELTFGAIAPDDVVKGIEGVVDTGKTVDDVKKLYSNQMVSEFILQSIFTKFKKLQKLEFNVGVLETLESHFFFDCNDLQKIVIKDSTFTKIPPKTFSNCSSLTEIDLSRNTIELLDRDTFFALEKLKFLILNDNKLSNVPGNAFSPLLNLEILDMGKNTLKSFDSKIFVNNKLLKQLVLANNKFNRMPKEYFDGLTHLETLDLTSSEVDAVEYAVFDKLEALKVAKFKSNLCIDKDYDDFKEGDRADFKKCIDNFNGGSILILSNLALILTIFIKFF